MQMTGSLKYLNSSDWRWSISDDKFWLTIMRRSNGKPIINIEEIYSEIDGY